MADGGREGVTARWGGTGYRGGASRGTPGGEVSCVGESFRWGAGTGRGGQARGMCPGKWRGGDRTRRADGARGWGLRGPVPPSPWLPCPAGGRLGPTCSARPDAEEGAPRGGGEALRVQHPAGPDAPRPGRAPPWAAPRRISPADPRRHGPAPSRPSRPCTAAPARVPRHPHAGPRFGKSRAVGRRTPETRAVREAPFTSRTGPPSAGMRTAVSPDPLCHFQRADPRPPIKPLVRAVLRAHDRAHGAMNGACEKEVRARGVDGGGQGTARNRRPARSAPIGRPWR